MYNLFVSTCKNADVVKDGWLNLGVSGIMEFEKSFPCQLLKGVAGLAIGVFPSLLQIIRKVCIPLLI